MQFLVVFSGLIAFCAGSAIPIIPKDNSHYVEGESRYIWMPDGKGTPHLVDLDKPVDEAVLNSRNGANNQYWLFTRSNPFNAQVLVHGNANSVFNSNYNGSRPLNVFIHGWLSNGNDGASLLTSSFLAVDDVNVIVVDWSSLAASDYVTAFAGVPNVGQFIANFLEWLINTGGGNWDNVHLIGHSLGAQVAGNAGRQAGGRARRVTGLDVARPLWEGNPNALNSNDGQYVEAIHTDGRIFGIFNQVGDADFYPNGGINPQPGCWDSICSHIRAFDLFASSVRTNHFVGRQCSNIQQAMNNQCFGSALNMGNGIIDKQGSGIYGLRTGSSWPF